MPFTLYTLAFTVVLFAGMLVFLEIGRRHGVRRPGQVDEGGFAGRGVVEGSVFGLLGLLLAFTFSGAAERFDTRRHLIVEEVTKIGTAWLRIDLLPADAQPAARNFFRQYLDARLEAYRKLPDIAAAAKALKKAEEIAANLWAHAVVLELGTECSGRTKAAPARAERDVRHCRHADPVGADTPAADHFRHAGLLRVGRRPARWIWHGTGS